MTSKLSADPQMTDVFGRFQNSTSPLSEPSGPTIDNRKKAMLSTAAVLLGGGITFAALNLDRLRESVSGNQETATDEVPVVPENELPIENEETATPVQHHVSSPVQNGTIKPNENIEIAAQVKEQMSFSEAYASARAEVGPGGIFSWHGQVYNTYTVEEWRALSLDQRQEFLSDVGYRPTQDTTNPTSPGPLPPTEPTYIELVINGRPGLGIDEDHDGIANAVVFLDKETDSLLAFVDSVGDNRIDTVFQLDASSQEIIGSQALDEPFLAEMDQLEAISELKYEENEVTNNIALVENMEESSAYDDDNDYTQEDGYVNDAELPEMD